MKLDRDTLEKVSLETVSADLYYDLADNIDGCTDEDLYKIIDCNGSYEKELKT